MENIVNNIIDDLVNEYCAYQNDVERVKNYITKALEGSESSLLELLAYVKADAWENGRDCGFIDGQNNILENTF